MAVLTITQVRHIPDPQRDYSFDVLFPTIGAYQPPYCESVEAPFYDNIPHPYLINYRSHNIAGEFTVSKFTATFYEDQQVIGTVGGTAEAWLNAWYALIRNPIDGTYFLPSNYKKTVTITKLDTRNIQVSQRQLSGVFPASVIPYKFASDLNGRVVLQVGFAFDDITSDPFALT